MIKISKLLIILGLLVFTGILNSQSRVEKITDDTFKKHIAKGFVIVKFTSKWSNDAYGVEAPKEKNYFKDVLGYQNAVVLVVASEDTRKTCKKLRLRNFPSIVLFHKGKKAEAWKADMDGKLDITTNTLKKAIDEILAGDVF